MGRFDWCDNPEQVIRQAVALASYRSHVAAQTCTPIEPPLIVVADDAWERVQQLMMRGSGG